MDTEQYQDATTEAIPEQAVPPPMEAAQDAAVAQSEYKIIDTSGNTKDGQNKCPKCGATEISLKGATGMLRCNFCRHEFEQIAAQGIEDDLDKLEGFIIGSGASNIEADSDSDDMITLKCESCGADVIIPTAENLQARCHWCRNTLSLNNKIPNGAVPDIVLPFGLTKDDAKKQVEAFVKDRWFFAHKQFKDEFTIDNIFGVYLPYMVIDVKAHTELEGEAEILVRKYSVKSGKNTKTYYDADAYKIRRAFDLTISDLTVEASQDKLDKSNLSKTNNIINSILPFDTENALAWDANYLKGYHSEKRDVNIDELKELVDKQSRDIARHQALSTAQQYDRGVRWEAQAHQVIGQQWLSAFLPVWLYSYQMGEKGKLYYTAVNARTKETMGSIPINYMRLLLATFGVFLLSLLPIDLISAEYEIKYLFLISAPTYFFYIYATYTNQGARHSHESETDAEMKNVEAQDSFFEHRKRLRRDRIKNESDTENAKRGLQLEVTNSWDD